MKRGDSPQLLACGKTARTLVLLALAAVFSLAVPRTAVAEVRSGDLVAGRRPASIGLPRAAMPDVEMEAGALITEDGRVLWSRSYTERRSMASLTKLMTAIVAIESTRTSGLITIPDASVSVGESTSFLRPGEKLPLSDLMGALLVKSGNDAAVALAQHVAGTEDAFVDMMNAKAAELGLRSTRFANPHGLDENGHYSSAADLGVLARYAMTKPQVRTVVADKYVRIGAGARAERFQSTNLLLGNYQGANGVKTGWTDEAGYCVIDSARRDGIELYAVVLGSSSELQRFKDARELLDFGFAHYRVQRLASAGSVIGEAPVGDYLDLSVGGAVSQDTSVPVFDLLGPISRKVSVATVKAPVEVGDRVGVATFSQAGEIIATVPLGATSQVDRPSILGRLGIAIARAWRALTGG